MGYQLFVYGVAMVREWVIDFPVMVNDGWAVTRSRVVNGLTLANVMFELKN